MVNRGDPISKQKEFQKRQQRLSNTKMHKGPSEPRARGSSPATVAVPSRGTRHTVCCGQACHMAENSAEHRPRSLREPLFRTDSEQRRVWCVLGSQMRRKPRKGTQVVAQPHGGGRLGTGLGCQQGFGGGMVRGSWSYEPGLQGEVWAGDRSE